VKPQDKKVHAALAARRPPATPARQIKPAALQRQGAVSAQSVKRPVAPGVYRPQATPIIAQAKLARMRTPPDAPLVHSPQPPGKTVQPKMAHETPPPIHPKVNAARLRAPAAYRPQSGSPSAQMKSRPVAPPVFRPQPLPKVLQTKKDNPYGSESDKSAAQTQSSSAPVACRPKTVRSSAVQPAMRGRHISKVVSNTAAGSRTVIQRIVLKTDNTAGEGAKRNNNFGERPSEPHREVPLATTIFSGKVVEQTRHHIIPWNTLSAFVRHAYDKDHLTELEEILTAAVTTMMSNSLRYIEGQRAPLAVNVLGGTRMQGDRVAKDLTDEIALPKADGVKNSTNVSAIETAYCWMPGNLFLGPLNTLRLDDPDEEFEAGAQAQVGGTFNNFQTAYNLIKIYVAAPNPTRESAAAIVALLKPAALQTVPFPFLENAWSRVELSTGYRYFLKANKDLPEVKKKISDDAPKAFEKYQKLIAEHDKWHREQQERWKMEKALSKAASAKVVV
jgi:hypothetical protein